MHAISQVKIQNRNEEIFSTYFHCNWQSTFTVQISILEHI